MEGFDDYVNYLESPDLWAPRRFALEPDDLDLANDRFSPAMYHTFEIPKDPTNPSAGSRTITAPNRLLKRAQYRILDMLIGCKLKGSDVAHAYYRGRSIKTMAAPHIGKRVVVKLDIASFFPSIRSTTVTQLLRRQKVPNDIITWVQRWCFLDNGLPVGAPTSPLLSNLVGAQILDRRLLGLTSKWRRRNITSAQRFRYERIDYTRYADDLVFSSNYAELPKIIPAIKFVIRQCGFAVNERKVSFRTQGKRQTVVGITVNEKMSKPRSYRRQLRNRLFIMMADIADGRCPPGFYIHPRTGELCEIRLDQIRGQIAHIRSLNPQQANSLNDRFVQLEAMCSGDSSLLTNIWLKERRARQHE